MHTRASNSELVDPLPEPERTLNRRLRRQNRRVPFEQRNNPPQHPRVVYPPILNINHFCHFLDILRNYDPMDDEPMWVADRVVAPTLGSAITIPETANEFSINGNHLTLFEGNQFDGRTKTDPHKHIYEFLKIYDMFKYRDTENEDVRLMMFPLSLNGEAKTWLDELNERTIESWDELRIAFISRFFPPTLFDRLLREIRAFSQQENESLTDAWLRMKEMLRNCHGHNLSKGNIIKIFYHGLNEITQEVLNAAAGGIFLYKTLNQAYQLLEDKVLLKLDWDKNQKTKSSLKKTVAFAAKGSSNFDTDKFMARMDAMTMKMDAQYKDFQSLSKRRAFWSLNEDILKITVLKTNTPYPSRKIRRIRACTHQRPQRNKDQYAVSRENQYAVFKIWNQYNILEDIKHGPYSKKSPIRRDLDNSTSNVLIPLDSWTSGLLVYKLPLSVEYGVSTFIGYDVPSSLSNTTYSSQQINMAYPLPLDTAYRLSGTEAEILKELQEVMAELILSDNLEKAPTESNHSFTGNNINIELSKEFLVELRKNIYHGTYNEDMVDHIVKEITTWEELVKKFFCKFYPESYDGEDEILDEGEN
ncbi:reverse transcriptase domain-containing protein [Tanacetum coccineum]